MEASPILQKRSRKRSRPRHSVGECTLLTPVP